MPARARQCDSNKTAPHHGFVPPICLGRTCRHRYNAHTDHQVKYFKQWRVADIQKKARIAQLEAEGAVKMDVSTAFDAGNGSTVPVTSGVPKGTSREDIQEMLARRKT